MHADGRWGRRRRRVGCRHTKMDCVGLDRNVTKSGWRRGREGVAQQKSCGFGEVDTLTARSAEGVESIRERGKNRWGEGAEEDSGVIRIHGSDKAVAGDSNAKLRLGTEPGGESLADK